MAWRVEKVAAGQMNSNDELKSTVQKCVTILSTSDRCIDIRVRSRSLAALELFAHHGKAAIQRRRRA